MPSLSWAKLAALTGASASVEEQQAVTALAISLLDRRLEGEAADAGLLLLAAHLWTVLEPRIASESVGGVSVSYAMPYIGSGFKATPWGLQYAELLRYKGDSLPVTVL